MKWALLLLVLYILRDVRGYPWHYDCPECNQKLIVQPVRHSGQLLQSQRSWMPRLSLLPSLSDTFNNTLDYMTKKLELLQETCKQITERLKEIIDELIPGKEKDKKRPLPSEIVSSDSKPEDFNQIVPKPDESIVNQKPVPVKDDEKKKPAKQGDKEDTLAPIKNNKNENTIAPSSNEKTVSTTPTSQAETTIKDNEKMENPETLDKNEKLQTTLVFEEKPQLEASKNDESEEENAQGNDDRKIMEEIKDPSRKIS